MDGLVYTNLNYLIGGKMKKEIFSQLKTMEMNLFDKAFIICFTLFAICYIYTGVSVLTIGGIILIYGAFLTYKGQIFLATASYIMADVCWISNAWNSNDIQGVIFIATGILFGIIATYKMKSGRMKKDLLKTETE